MQSLSRVQVRDLGPAGGAAMRAVQRAVPGAEVEQEEGRLPALPELPSRVGGRGGVTDPLQAFLTHLAGERHLSPRTVEAYRFEVDRLIRWIAPRGPLAP